MNKKLKERKKNLALEDPPNQGLHFRGKFLGGEPRRRLLPIS